MFEHSEDLVRLEGVSNKKKKSTSTEKCQETTPQKPKPGRNFTAILEALSPSKRSLFEKRGVIRSSPKITFPNRLEPEEKPSLKKKKKKNQEGSVATAGQKIVKPHEEQSNEQEKKREAFGSVGLPDILCLDTEPVDTISKQEEVKDSSQNTLVSKKKKVRLSKSIQAHSQNIHPFSENLTSTKQCQQHTSTQYKHAALLGSKEVESAKKTILFESFKGKDITGAGSNTNNSLESSYVENTTEMLENACQFSENLPPTNFRKRDIDDVHKDKAYSQASANFMSGEPKKKRRKRKKKKTVKNSSGTLPALSNYAPQISVTTSNLDESSKVDSCTYDISDDLTKSKEDIMSDGSIENVPQNSHLPEAQSATGTASLDLFSGNGYSCLEDSEIFGETQNQDMVLETVAIVEECGVETKMPANNLQVEDTPEQNVEMEIPEPNEASKDLEDIHSHSSGSIFKLRRKQSGVFENRVNYKEGDAQCHNPIGDIVNSAFPIKGSLESDKELVISDPASFAKKLNLPMEKTPECISTENATSAFVNSGYICSTPVNGSLSNLTTPILTDSSMFNHEFQPSLIKEEEEYQPLKTENNSYNLINFPEPDLFRKVTFVLDKLFSRSISRAFISPTGTTHLYTPPPGGLNLAILDRKLWHGRYDSFEGFIQDLKRIADMVSINYDDTDEIYFISQSFVDFYESIAKEIRGRSLEQLMILEKQEVSPFEAQDLIDVIRNHRCDKNSIFYIVKLATPTEVERSSLELLEKETFAAVHYPILESFGSTPDVSSSPESPLLPTVFRIFVSYNRTVLELARDEPNGYLLIFTNVKGSKVTTKGHIRLQADCFVTKPIGQRHDIDDVDILQCLDSMKSWIKVVVVKAFKFDAEVPNKFRSAHLSKPFRPVKFNPRTMGEGQLAQVIMEADNYWDSKVVEERLSEMTRKPIEITANHLTEVNHERLMKLDSDNTKPSRSLNEAIDERDDTLAGKDSEVDLHIPESPNSRSMAHHYVASSNGMQNLLADLDVPTEERVSCSISDDSFPQLEIHTQQNVDSESKSDLIEDGVVCETQHNGCDKGNNNLPKLPVEEIRIFNSSLLPSEANAIYLKLKAIGLELGIKFKSFRDVLPQSLSQNPVVGQFKKVHISTSDPSTVVQLYKDVGEEFIESRLMELVCLLKLRGVKRVGEILSILESESGNPVGLTMTRYQKTLKEYLHVRHKISSHQKYKLMRDMIAAVKILHEQGIAHRDLSEVNVMVNEVDGVYLKDGTLRPKVILIDYGKARLTQKEDIQKWYLKPLPPDEEKLLPRIKSIPDHGYKRYRSINTLPKNKKDWDILPYSINPFAEDIYSLGILLWRTFTQQNPWAGVFDDDIKGLREIVGDAQRLRTEIHRSIPGLKCQELLFGCLAVNDEDRWNINQLSEWIWNKENRVQLISEIDRDFSGRQSIRRSMGRV